MTETTMPRSNLTVAERQLGQELRSLVRTYDRQIRKHVEYVREIHQTILAIGRKLLAAKALPGNASTKNFSAWCQRYGMAEGPFRDAQERSNAMLLATLHDEGVAPHGLEEGLDGQPTPERIKLDLTECRRTAPTNILSWARKHQPEIFPNLAKKREEARRAKGLQTKDSGEKSWPQDDDIADVGLGPRLAHEVNRGGVPEVADVLAENRRLTDEVGRLTKENAALSAEVETLRRRLTERPAKPEPQRVSVLKAEIAALKAKIVDLTPQRLPA